MKHASDLTAVPEGLAEEPALTHAFEIANKANLTAEELDSQERREMFIQDQRGAIELAVARSVEIAESRGIERGDKKARLDIAKRLLDGLDNETIAEKTGLTIDEVKQHRIEFS